jgi:E3 ubiquitin-protein ligase UHRF1
VKDPPISKKPVQSGNPVSDKEIRKYQRQARMSVTERLLKGSFCCDVLFWLRKIGIYSKWFSNYIVIYAEFGCSICRNVIKEPMTTPCAHNFCKMCLLGSFEDKASMRERSRGGRTLRAQKIVKKCPLCPTDICDFMENPQVQLIKPKFVKA